MMVKILEEEKMQDERGIASIVPIHKKLDSANFDNYRGIALLLTCYKELTKIIDEKLKIVYESIIQQYQPGFRRNMTTTDNIFALRRKIDNYWEYGKDVHFHFLDVTSLDEVLKILDETFLKTETVHSLIGEMQIIKQ